MVINLKFIGCHPKCPFSNGTIRYGGHRLPCMSRGVRENPHGCRLDGGVWVKEHCSERGR